MLSSRRSAYNFTTRTARPSGRWPTSMADDAKPETALARPMIATDLDKAGKGQLVYVGRDGEVKHPRAVRNRQIAAYLTFGGITAAGVALAATSFPVLLPVYLALGRRFL